MQTHLDRYWIALATALWLFAGDPAAAQDTIIDADREVVGEVLDLTGESLGVGQTQDAILTLREGGQLLSNRLSLGLSAGVLGSLEVLGPDSSAVAGQAEIGGVAFAGDDIVLWDTTNMIASVFFVGSSVFADPENIDARTGMALASYYGGLAFTRTSVGYVHAIAHNLGAKYGTPHGLANALALPHVLEFSEAAARDRLGELGALVGVDGSTAFIAEVRRLAADIAIPTTLDSLRPGDIDELADLALAEAFLDYPVPRYMSRDDCVAVITKLLPA